MIAFPMAAILVEERVLDDETVSPGLLGFGVFLLLVVATFFLVRSMNKQLRKVPPKFEGEDDVDDAPPPENAAGDTNDGSGEERPR